MNIKQFFFILVTLELFIYFFVGVNQFNENCYLCMFFLFFQTKPVEVMLPKKCQLRMDKLLALLDDNQLNKKRILVHGFSVGAYAYGEMLVKILNPDTKWEGIRDRIMGQIFDSPVDFDQVPFGFSNAVFKNKAVQKVSQSLIEKYLKVNYNNVTRHYKHSSKHFIENRLRLPSLMLYSRADPVGVDHRIEEVGIIYYSGLLDWHQFEQIWDF